ncbi:MAG TPA: TIR domain-containing protein [Steroidobacteraceae bacterium]|nr:TIR domain-containing protein [Steroidobacteraceae bacterium]
MPRSTHDVFISYRRSDQLKAELLHRLLAERGVNAWYDALLSAGEDWRARTAKALVEAPVFVLLFSKSAAQSDEIVKELSAATMQKKVVIPVRLEDIRPEGAFLYELASRNWFEAYEHTETRLAVLAEQLAALVGQAVSPPAGESSALAAVVARQRRWTPFVVGALALAALIVASAYFALGPSGKAADDPGQSQRVAFFGFTATDGDLATKNIAALATDESFVNFAAQRVKTIARADVSGAPDKPRLDRAGELGAKYALSGDVRRDGDRARFTMRLEDVPSRITLWEGTLDGAIATPVPTGFSASDRVVEVTDCITTSAYTGEEGPHDEQTLSLVAPACGAIHTQGGLTKFIGLLRQMVQRDLGGPDRDASFAFFLVYALPPASPAQRTTMLRESGESLARAQKLRPRAYATATAQQGLSLATNAAPLAWIPAIERSLEQAPRPSDAYWYARANRSAGASMLAVGRVRDAVGYLKSATDVDSLTASNVTAYAVALAASGLIIPGQTSWDERIDKLMQARPDMWTWEFAVAASIFTGTGDTERLFQQAPGTLPAYVVPCYRNLHASMKLTGAQAKLAAAKKAEACLTEFDSPHMVVQAAAMLGDIDKAFEMIDTSEKAHLLLRYYYPPWFMPSTRAMRADPRFLPLMQKLGYVAYWKQTGTQPDVCGTKEEKDIPLCAALAAGS